MDREGVVIRTLAPREGVQFQIVVGAAEPDSISQEIRQQAFRFPPPFVLAFALLKPGDRVLDLGAHIGTFSLAAAALGCEVMAVEASPLNAALLRESATQNGYQDLNVVCTAISDRSGTLSFVQGGPYGQVANPHAQSPTIEVPAITVDQLLDEQKWDGVDFIKMDIEGSEVKGLRGMSRLLSAADAPLILYESNGHTLAFFGQTPNDLIAALAEFGYFSYLIEPGRLVPVSPDDLQVDCNVDYLAARRPFVVPPGWQVDQPMSEQEIVSRIVKACAHPNDHHRTYTARTLAGAGPQILTNGRVRRAMYALKNDPDPDVRAAASWWPAGGSGVLRGWDRAVTTIRGKLVRASRRALLDAAETKSSSAACPTTERRGASHQESRSEAMTDESLAAGLTIEGEDLDTEAIMQEIRGRIRARRAEARAQGLDWEAYADGLYPVPPDAVLSRDLHEAVRYATLGYDKVAVDMLLTESRLPLIGGLVQRVRATLHELVLFYVNRMAARQIRFNQQAARGLALMVRDLESEVRDLRSRIAELEAGRE